ncbi:MAG: tetratricopeptide repeat protein [Thermodesulfobacteriota bacterium]
MSKPSVPPKATTQTKKAEGNLPETKTPSLNRRFLTLCMSLILIVAILAVFCQVRHHEFISFDDKEYVTDNPHVKSGVTLSGTTWAFLAMHSNNWHPLTWLSHMLDCELYGLNPGGHHLTNLMIHIANTLLLFLVLKRMTGALWKSSFVAALFALHPLHVESVAWVAERKDVLSTFFWMLTMGTYFRYVNYPRLHRYFLVLLSFAMGLLSKPMLVTLPFVLLLLDYWPLGRFRLGKSIDHRIGSMNSCGSKSSAFSLISEKSPFFVLAAIAAVLTVFAQQRGGTVKSLEFFPIGVRIANALVSYVSYIGKMIWPPPMAILYPYPDHFHLWGIAGASLFLVVVTLLVIRAVRSYPYLAVGWLWYLGTLVPVIGLVQVGMQAMADRYTYVPFIGLFIMVAWGVPDILKGWRYRKIILAVSSSLLLLIFTILAWMQVQRWQDSMTLFEHTVRVTAKNFLIHNKLGNALFQKGEIGKAMTHYQEALRINPNFVEAYNNIGNALFYNGDVQRAIDYYTKALSQAPDYADAHNNLGFALARQGKIEEAITHYQEALRIRPDFAQAQYNLGIALADQGKSEEALAHFAKALRNKSGDADAHNNLGVALARQGKGKEALVQFAKALEIDPNFAEAHCNMGNSLTELGKIDEAIAHYREALRIRPSYPMARYNLGNALLRQGKIEEAIVHYTEALRGRADFAEAHFSRGLAYLMIGNRGAAMEEYEVLKKIHPDLANALSQKMIK